MISVVFCVIIFVLYLFGERFVLKDEAPRLSVSINIQILFKKLSTSQLVLLGYSFLITSDSACSILLEKSLPYLKGVTENIAVLTLFHYLWMLKTAIYICYSTRPLSRKRFLSFHNNSQHSYMPIYLSAHAARVPSIPALHF